jgi:hypothetical protein
MRDETDRLKLSRLVGQYFVRLNKFNELIAFAFGYSGATKINIYIDLYSIKNTILGIDFVYSSNTELCALILDMCVHYKNYFYGLSVEPTFYLVDSNNLPISSKMIYPTYNSKFAMKLTSRNTDYIDINMDMLDKICAYLPEVHYIKTTAEAGVMIAAIQHRKSLPEAVRTPAIVIGKDPYMSMLPGLFMHGTENMGIISDVALIVPRKSNNEDLSKVYTFANIYEYVQNINNIRSENFRPCRFGPGLLDKLYALTKFEARSMPPIMQYRSVNKLIDENPALIYADPLDIYAAWAKGTSRMPSDNIDARYRAISLSYNLTMFHNTAEYTIAMNKALGPKLANVDQLKHMNNVYFEQNPLMLDDLLK